MKYSSKRLIDGYFNDVWNSVCSMRKPVLSAAYHVRMIFMPPNGRTAMAPALAAPRAAPMLQLHQFLVISLTNSSTASWSVSQSPPETVSLK